MTTKFRKNRKKRGRIGKHRKHPGGRGNAGDSTTTGSSSTSTIMDTFGKLEKATKCNTPLIDVTQFGYFKVLEKGSLPADHTVVVKAELITKTAEKKMTEAGGAVILTA